MFKIKRTKNQDRNSDAQLIDRLLETLNDVREDAKELKAKRRAETKALAIYNQQVRQLIGNDAYFKLTNEYTKNVMNHL